MDRGQLPPKPPSGMKRYRATIQGSNPFAPKGPYEVTQTTDVDESMSFEQVEEFARQAARDMRCRLVKLEVVG